MLRKIVSGGQTGVDQGALKAAIACKLLHGGWCPPDKICENGVIPPSFKLVETQVEVSDLAPDIPRSLRTELNVRDSDGTLVIRNRDNNIDKGTNWSIQCTKHYNKPLLEISIGELKIEEIQSWIVANNISILNVSGPSESSVPGIEYLVFKFISSLIMP